MFAFSCLSLRLNTAGESVGLPQRADSERSWTVDIVARRERAKREADPFRAQAGNRRRLSACQVVDVV